MPSVTYWNRLEPRPRAESLIEPLRARLRDPLWLLARQWALAELRGADAGSPAWVELGLRSGTLRDIRIGTRPPQPVGVMPIERQAEAEPVSADLATRIELGQVLIRLLMDRLAPDLVPLFRAAYPIARLPVDPDDRAEVELRLMCGGRSIDGARVVEAARTGEALPATIPLPRQAIATDAMAALLEWADATLGPLGDGETEAWQPDRLEQRFEVGGVAPDGREVVLSGKPDGEGLATWDAFDVHYTGVTTAAAPVERRTIVPAHVRFRGMPNARFWDFESGGTDFGAITTDRRDLARMALIEFMLVQSNDWFHIPVDLAVGALTSVDALIVRDVFGMLTQVVRTDRSPGESGRFRMFVPTATEVGGVVDFMLVPPTAASVVQKGQPFEEVRFVRDETANMVWGIEHLTPNAAGVGWLGRERDASRRGAGPGQPGSATALHWTIETEVPEHWIPFLPVALDPARGVIALERSAMLRPGSPPEPIHPRGAILQPQSIGSAPYRVAEEEIPRTGLTVQRRHARARWFDGSTHFWTARSRRIGFGEADSALKFDVAEDHAG